MGMIMDVIKSLSDMHQLSKLTDSIEEEINKLEKEGKLPAELKTAFEALKNGTSGSDSNNIEAAVEPLKKFAEEMEKYENLFPDNVKSIVSKFESITSDIEGVSKDLENRTKTN